MTVGSVRKIAGALALVLFSTALIFGCVGPGGSGGGAGSYPQSTASQSPSPLPSGLPSASASPNISPMPSPSPSTTAPTPSPTLAWGPRVSDLEQAITEAEQMELQDLAGLVVVARYPGTSAAQTAKLVRTYRLGGVVHFASNATTPKQMYEFSAVLQQAQQEMGRDWPLIISVDQEGGNVQRLLDPWPRYPVFMGVGAAGGPEQVQAASGLAQDLRASGINMNFAPVADVTIGLSDPTIGTRAAGEDPVLVARAVINTVQGHREAAVLPVVKHFPGHGSVREDSHLALPLQQASVAQLAAHDWVPFRTAIAHGAPAIMMGHIEVPSIAPGMPSSLSTEHYRILREDLGFTGVIITDGLDMAGVAQGRTPGQVAVQALQAGADVLLIPANVPAAVQGIITAVQDGTLSRERLNEAGGRIITLMRWQQQLNDLVPMPPPTQVGADVAGRQALAAAAITQVAGTCQRLGILDGQRIPSVNLIGGSEGDREAFVNAALAAGMNVTGKAEVKVRLLSSARAVPDGGAVDVVVAVESPYGLANTPGSVKLAMFGRTSEAFDALIAVLQARAGAPGTSPVSIGQVQAGTRLCAG